MHAAAAVQTQTWDHSQRVKLLGKSREEPSVCVSVYDRCPPGILWQSRGRHPDSGLGWAFVPARTGYNPSGGRRIEYVFDAGGYRVRDANHPVDRARPSILFAGESIMFGDGLTYDETVPFRVETIAGLQS